MSGKRTRIKITAYHEAGHALAALREGRPVRWVAAFWDKPGNGVCYCKRRKRNPYDLTSNPADALVSWMHTLESTRSDIRISLAGPLAQAKILSKPLRLLGAKSDLENCLNLASRLNHLHSYVSQFAKIAPINTETLINNERMLMHRWLSRPEIWDSVERLAGRIFQTGAVGNQLIDEYVRKASSNDAQGNFLFRKPFGRV